MLNQTFIELSSEQETKFLAQNMAKLIAEKFAAGSKPFIVYLVGDLGAGKSFFSRAFIHYFLPTARVKSPTYTLVESYQTQNFPIHHFDLYRLCEPEELEFLGVRDLLNGQTIALVEWPSKAEGVIPEADLLIEIQHAQEGGNERSIAFTSYSQLADLIVEEL